MKNGLLPIWKVFVLVFIMFFMSPSLLVIRMIGGKNVWINFMEFLDKTIPIKK